MKEHFTAPRQMTNAGFGGHCYYLRATDCNQYKSCVPDLSPVFCATGRNCGLVLIRSLSIALIEVSATSLTTAEPEKLRDRFPARSPMALTCSNSTPDKVLRLKKRQ